MKTTPRVLKILAGFVWYAGGIILGLKGMSLLFEAEALALGQEWHWYVTIFAGIVVGGIKAKFIFNKSIRKNLRRIDALDRPRIYLCFRPWFFLFLAAMIATGATLSRLAHGNYVFLLSVAALDISLSVALLTSSIVFWKKRAFFKA